MEGGGKGGKIRTTVIASSVRYMVIVIEWANRMVLLASNSSLKIACVGFLFFFLSNQCLSVGSQSDIISDCNL